MIGSTLSTLYYSSARAYQLRLRLDLGKLSGYQVLQDFQKNLLYARTDGNHSLSYKNNSIAATANVYLLVYVLKFSRDLDQRNIASFFGRVDWSFAQHSCEFSGELGNKKTYRVKVTFNKDNPENDVASNAFSLWLDQPLPSGNGTRRSQFTDVEKIQRELWTAATDEWGPPAIDGNGRPTPVLPDSTKDQGQQTLVDTSTTNKQKTTTSITQVKTGGRSRNTTGKPPQSAGGRLQRWLGNGIAVH